MICWNIINWTFRNKLQWNFTRSSNIIIEKNTFEYIICENVAILSRPQYVNIVGVTQNSTCDINYEAYW